MCVEAAALQTRHFIVRTNDIMSREVSKRIKYICSRQQSECHIGVFCSLPVATNTQKMLANLVNVTELAVQMSACEHISEVHL